MAEYSVLFSLNQDLDLILPSRQPSSCIEFLGFLQNKVKEMDQLLRGTTGDLYLGTRARYVVDQVQQKLLLREHYESVREIESLLKHSMGNDYEQSKIRDVVVSMKNDSDLHGPLFSIDEIHELLDNVDSLVANISESQITEILISIGLDIEKKFEQFFISPELQKLRSNFRSMDSLLRDSSGESYDPQKKAKFGNRIRDVAHRAVNHVHFKNQLEVLVPFEDLNLSHSVQETRRSSVTHSFRQQLTELSTITQEILCINGELKEFPNAIIASGTVSTTGNSSPSLIPQKQLPQNDGKLVGLKNHLYKMLNCLTKESLSFKVLTVVGMAGIGKTTFAKELYDNLLVINHFDVRAWATISQEYQLKGLILQLLSNIITLSNEMYKKNEEELKLLLHQSLMGRRYLIVLDDVWDTKAWNELKRFFPDDKNDSRVLLTSRHREVALDASPDFPPHCLHILNTEESWELLCSKVFRDELPPEELLSIGKEIADKCYGLPLAIVVMGGLLSNIEKSQTAWKRVAQDVGSMVMDKAQRCLSILALSYNHLPDLLKACFLYMAVFPGDYNVSSKKLKCLWIAEGFVQRSEQKTLEETAQDYLEDLVARSLIMVKRKGSNGRIKACHIHDLMRELCLREGREGNFLRVFRKYGEMPTGNERHIEPDVELLDSDIPSLQRVSFHSNICLYLRNRASLPFTRSFFGFESLRPTDLKGCSGLYFKLLKILDIMHVHLSSLPQGLLLLPNLKYTGLTIENPILSSELFELQKLQTCIIDGEWVGSLSKEFWDMSELRHFHLKRRSSSNSASCHTSAFRVLQNLHSLSTVGPEWCSKEIFNCMPNLKKLGVFQTEEDDKFIEWFQNLMHLKQLETLKYTFTNPFGESHVRPVRCPAYDHFPLSLMKLTLSGTSFPWEDMQQLSMLPKLRVIKLKNYAFKGKVWDLGDTTFDCLIFLQIGSTDLDLWEAKATNFPKLEHIVLRHSRYLKAIPSDIGDLSLKKIELHYCAHSAAKSARELQEEQREYGNEELTVYVTERRRI